MGTKRVPRPGATIPLHARDRAFAARIPSAPDLVGTSNLPRASLEAPYSVVRSHRSRIKTALCRHFSSGANRDRTGDLLLAKQALSQLSYGPSSLEFRARIAARMVLLPTPSSPTRQRADDGGCRILVCPGWPVSRRRSPREPPTLAFLRGSLRGRYPRRWGRRPAVSGRTTRRFSCSSSTVRMSSSAVSSPPCAAQALVLRPVSTLAVLPARRSGSPSAAAASSATTGVRALLAPHVRSRPDRRPQALELQVFADGVVEQSHCAANHTALARPRLATTLLCLAHDRRRGRAGL